MSRVEAAVTDGLVTLTAPRGAAAEAYRVLRTNLAFAPPGGPARLLVIASPGAGEGASATVANLAVVTAEAGWRVLVVDADLRRPAQHGLFGLSGAAGLSTALADATDQAPPPGLATGIDGLALLPAGPLPPNPAELLGGARLGTVLGPLRAAADIVLVDVPPVTAAADAALVAAQADGVVLVLTAGRSRRDDTERARAQLDRVGATVLGVVLIGGEGAGRTGRY